MASTIPNTFHFVFGLKPQRRPFHLLHYLCLRSCIEVNRPEKVYFYYLHEPHGRYWDLIRDRLAMERVDPVPLVSETPYADAAARHYSYAHHADFIRVEKLIERGGVYADMDTIFVSPIPEHLFSQPFVLGREQDFGCAKTGRMLPSLCNALIMSPPGAEFGRRWLREMAETFDGEWSDHSGRLPWRLSRRHPDLIHVEPVRSFFPYACSPSGIQTLLEGCDRDLDGVFSIHLWLHMWASWWRRDCTTMHEGRLTEQFVRSADTTYNLVARRFLPDSDRSAGGAPLTPRRITRADRLITRVGLRLAASRGTIEQWSTRLTRKR